jgi:hypothetical protein
MAQPPVANAGSAQTVAAGAAVALDGTHSSDPQGLPLTYAWTQTAGPSVALVNANSASPTFTAPSSLSADAAVTFQLVVNDGNESSGAASVLVTVLAASAAPDNRPTVTIGGTPSRASSL